MILPYFGSTRHSLNSAEKEMELSRFPTENISPFGLYNPNMAKSQFSI